MKKTLFITMLAAALLGSGVANAEGTYYASDYTGDDISLGTDWQDYDKLVVDTPLTMTGSNGFLDLYNGATIEFQKNKEAESICSIFTSEKRGGMNTVYFNPLSDVYNFTFDEGAQAIVAGSAGTPITLIQDLNMQSAGFYIAGPTTFQLNGKVAGESVEMGGVQFTYVGPMDDSYDFQEGEIGFKGYAEGSHALYLVAKAPVPPPVPAAEADALDVTLVNSLWASSAYVREFVRLSEAQGYALKNGDTAVWGGGFGAFMHVTGDKGFKSNGGGYGIGVNHAFSDNTQGGISFGQGFGTYHNSGVDGATVHQRAILAAATASTRIGKDFSLGGHLAFGSVRNRADCRLDGATERARWNDNVFNLGAQAAYDFHVTETTAITPFLGLDWAYGAQESINGAYGRHYSHGRLNELRMPVGVTVSTSTEVGTTTLLPHLSVAYVPSLAQQNPHAGVTGADGNYRVKGYAPGRNAFMLNAGVNAVFSDSWSAGASYTLETRRHSVDQSVNASVRYTF